jgi:hypothetical protein
VGLRIRHNFSRLVSLSKHLGKSVLTEVQTSQVWRALRPSTTNPPGLGEGPGGFCRFLYLEILGLNSNPAWRAPLSVNSPDSPIHPQS